MRPAGVQTSESDSKRRRPLRTLQCIHKASLEDLVYVEHSLSAEEVDGINRTWPLPSGS